MGQKVSPIGFRTGITIGWKSRWFAPKSNFGEFLVEDERIRRFVDKRLNQQPPYAAISDVEIERTREEVKVILRTARPGLVIGPKGAEVDKLKDALEDLTDHRVNINIVEIRNPDRDAKLVAESIAEQLRRRAGFRRVMKQRAEQAMQSGIKGIKIMLSGRLGGAEMSRSEKKILGSIPLHTVGADGGYGFVACFTTYGCIGVKVWIYRGMFGDADHSEDTAPGQGATPPRYRQGGPSRGGPSRGGPSRGGPSRGGPSRRAGGSSRRRPADASAAAGPVDQATTTSPTDEVAPPPPSPGDGGQQSPPDIEET